MQNILQLDDAELARFFERAANYNGSDQICLDREKEKLEKIAEISLSDLSAKKRVQALFKFLGRCAATLTSVCSNVGVVWQAIEVKAERSAFLEFFQAKFQEHGMGFFGYFYSGTNLEFFDRVLNDLEQIEDSQEEAKEAFWVLFGFAICIQARIVQVRKIAQTKDNSGSGFWAF